MRDIPVLPVDEDIEKATNTLAETMTDEINLIKVDPPEQSDGMDAAKEFLESVHLLDFDRHMLFSKKNTSPTCGMEMWYDENLVKFVFYTPSDTIEKEYRQQLSGYYDGCDIAQKTPNEGMFIKTDSEENESIAVIDMQLKEHYFNPISSPVSEENEMDSDPFQRIINEIDTKDDTRAMLQVLYKPAPYDWTELQHETLETYAKKIQNKGGFKTRWFGLKIDDVDDPGIFEGAASEMRSRLNKPAYYVNIRIAIVTRGQSQEQADKRAKARANAVVNTLEHLYETRAQQKLKPRTYKVNEQRNAKETLVNMIERNGTNMSQSSQIHKHLWEKLTPNYSTIVLTSGELSGLVHLPSSDELTSGAVEWTDQMVEGTVPPDVDDFEPVSPDERDGVEGEPDLSGDDDEDDLGTDTSDDEASVLFDEGD